MEQHVAVCDFWQPTCTVCGAQNHDEVWECIDCKECFCAQHWDHDCAGWHAAPGERVAATAGPETQSSLRPECAAAAPKRRVDPPGAYVDEESQRALVERRDSSGRLVGAMGASQLHPAYPHGGAASFLRGSRSELLPMGQSPEMNIPVVSIGADLSSWFHSGRVGQEID